MTSARNGPGEGKGALDRFSNDMFYPFVVGGRPNLALTTGSLPVYGGALGSPNLFTNLSNGLDPKEVLPNLAATDPGVKLSGINDLPVAPETNDAADCSLSLYAPTSILFKFPANAVKLVDMPGGSLDAAAVIKSWGTRLLDSLLALFTPYRFSRAERPPLATTWLT